MDMFHSFLIFEIMLLSSGLSDVSDMDVMASPESKRFIEMILKPLYEIFEKIKSHQWPLPPAWDLGRLIGAKKVVLEIREFFKPRDLEVTVRLSKISIQEGGGGKVWINKFMAISLKSFAPWVLSKALGISLGAKRDFGFRINPLSK